MQADYIIVGSGSAGSARRGPVVTRQGLVDGVTAESRALTVLDGHLGLENVTGDGRRPRTRGGQGRAHLDLDSQVDAVAATGCLLSARP